MKPERLTRVNELIKEQVSALLQEYVAGNVGVMLTVVRVDTAPNLSTATVYVSCLQEGVSPKEILKHIHPVVPQMQHALNRILTLKKVPKLVFHVDLTREATSRIEELLAQEEASLANLKGER